MFREPSAGGRRSAIGRRSLCRVALLGLLLHVAQPVPLRAESSSGLKEKHAERITSIAWSPDGNRVATAAFDGTVRVWNAVSGREERRLRASSRVVLFTSWSPKGDRLLSATGDAVQLFDVESGGEVASIATRIAAKAVPRWSPDGETVALPTFDGPIELLDRNGTGRGRLGGHAREVSSVAWSPDGRWLGSGAWDGTVRIWDASTHEPRRSFEGLPIGAMRVAWSPDGGALGAYAAMTVGVYLLDARSGASRLLRTAGPVTGLAWQPAGALLAAGLADGTIELWDVAEASLRARTRCGRLIDELAWSVSGRWLAAVGFWEKSVCVWDATTESVIAVRGHREAVIALAWSPTASRLASGGYDGRVRLWSPRGAPRERADR